MATNNDPQAPPPARLQGRAVHASISSEDVLERKRFLEFGDDDVDRLVALNPIAQAYAGPVIDAFYEHLLRFGETAAFFRDPDVLDRVKGLQKEYFLRLTSGSYDDLYVENRLKIGAVHERIGLPIVSYLGMYSFYLRNVASRLMAAYQHDPEQVSGMFHSLMKLVFLDMSFAIDTYIAQRERTIEEQQRAIRELSTPVLRVRDRLLVLPIIGELDASRARQLTAGLLQSISSSRAKVVILDVTGVPSIDSTVANNLIQTVDASQLMGAKVIVTGLSSSVASTLVMLGLDLDKLNAVGDLQGGIEVAERILGYRVVAIDQGSAEAASGVGSDPQAR
jgi:rsbT co-antagonist protein RsbR